MPQLGGPWCRPLGRLACAVINTEISGPPSRFEGLKDIVIRIHAPGFSKWNHLFPEGTELCRAKEMLQRISHQIALQNLPSGTLLIERLIHRIRNPHGNGCHVLIGNTFPAIDTTFDWQLFFPAMQFNSNLLNESNICRHIELR